MLARLLGCAVIALVASCLESSAVKCGDSFCPEDSRCGGDGEDVCVPLTCGDGELLATEECDGDQLTDRDCTAFGYYESGTLTCTTSCRFDVSSCDGGTCGDGRVDAAGQEACDQSLSTLRCGDLGYDIGRVGCRRRARAISATAIASTGRSRHRERRRT